MMSEPLRVLLLENIHPFAREIFEREGLRVEEVPSALPDEELRARLEHVDILGIRSKTTLRAHVLENAPRLLSIGCFCIGTNQVDLATAARRGIPVFNAPFSNTRSVAELILCEVIMLARRLGDRVREMHEGIWKKVAAGSAEVRGKTLGIVGYGHIGSQVGVLAEAIGMRVLFYDTQVKLPMGNNRPLGELHEVLQASDFVTLHVPETPQTRNMIGEKELSLMKKGACLLNASRGSVVDLSALGRALQSGALGGASVDVYPEEPEGNSNDFSCTLRGLPNVIMTPHIGGSTSEAQAAIGKEVGTSLARFLRTGTTTGAVNFPHMELPQAPGTHRVQNVHKNVPGVLRDINRIVSELGANIRGQLLATDADIGYLLMDLDQDVSFAVGDRIAALQTNIRTRILG